MEHVEFERLVGLTLTYPLKNVYGIVDYTTISYQKDRNEIMLANVEFTLVPHSVDLYYLSHSYKTIANLNALQNVHLAIENLNKTFWIVV